MYELRTCDFCDGDAAGTFVVVPPELEPTADEQRRVLCCQSCQNQLESLLEPLVSRLLSEDDRDDSVRDDDIADDTDGTASAATAASQQLGTNDANGANDASEETDDGITLESTQSQSKSEFQSTPETQSQQTAIEQTATEQTATEQTATEQPTPESRPPKAYSKVIRLLRNREFPMERSAVEALAAGAYDLETPEVQAVIEHALEQGELREDGEQLQRR